MKLTMHLRWHVREHWEGDVMMPIERRVLQQFVELHRDDADIALPKDIGPDGIPGRWQDVREAS